MQKLTVYVDDETKRIIDEMAKEEQRNVTFIAAKLIMRGIRETVRKKKGGKDGLQSGQS